MTTIFSKSPRSQSLFTYGISLPTPVELHAMLVPTMGNKLARLYTTQTEPSLQMTLKGGSTMGLNDTDYDYFYNMDLRATGSPIVTGGAVALSFDDNEDPVFAYDWIVGDTSVSGAYNGQFRVVRKADGYSMLQDIFLLWIYPAI